MCPHPRPVEVMFHHWIYWILLFYPKMFGKMRVRNDPNTTSWLTDKVVFSVINIYILISYKNWKIAVTCGMYTISGYCIFFRGHTTAYEDVAKSKPHGDIIKSKASLAVSCPKN
jgi:hypothetical protein